MAATGSDYLYTEINDFFLYNLLGYQDVNEQKDGLNRLEAAFASQHMWDRTSDDATWAGAHAPDPGSGPTRDLGNHGGNVGIDDGADQTEYYGSGTHIHNVLRFASGGYTGDGTIGGSKVISTGFDTGTRIIVVTGPGSIVGKGNLPCAWLWFYGCASYPFMIASVDDPINAYDNIHLIVPGVTNITTSGTGFSVGVNGTADYGPNINAQTYKWAAIGL